LCLVTGATGFIGGCLTRRLLSDGYRVRALARVSSDTGGLRALGVEIAIADLAATSSQALAAAMDGVSHVVHCAALVSDWARVEEILATNVDGTRALVAGAREASVERFIHLSTTDVYGYPGTAAVDETFVATGFRNWYAESKLRAESEVLRASGDLATVILRPATVYGPGSTDVIGEIARAIRARHMLVLNRGAVLAGLCYVENLIDACMLALRHEGAAAGAFNITDGSDVTWRRFTHDLAAGLDRPPPRLSLAYRPARALGAVLEAAYRLWRRAGGPRTAALLSRQAVDVLGCNQDFSNRRAREVLGWQPRVDYDSGLAATLAWLNDEYLE
jgi:nucleoside-diphosphate-sugar epimerase